MVTYLEDGSNVVRAAAEYQHARHPKGMVFLGGELGCFRESFQEIEVPAVLVTSSAEELALPNLSSVTIDNESAARDAVAHLCEMGHRRIGIVGGALDGGQISCLRLRGAEDALRAHGIELDYGRDFEPCDFLESGGFEAAGRLLDRTPDLTAIFALGDVVAFGALRAICDRGLSVPGDVSLVGFDDTAFSQYSVPRITTIRQNAELLGRRAARVILSGMRERAAAVHELVPYELVERESVRAV